MRKKAIAYGLLFSVLLGTLPFLASAAFIQTRGDVNLNAGQVINDDVYAAGGNINSAATINGDFVVAGGNVTISGNTTEDLIVAGGSVNLQGQVGDDIRAAGGEVRITGPITDDLVVTGGQVTIDPQATIGGDIVAAGGQVTINGKVAGNVSIAAGQVAIGNQAVISGKLEYSSPNQATIQSGSQIAGGVTYNQTRGRMGFGGAGLGFGLIIQFLMLALTALLLQWLLGGWAHRLVDSSSRNFWGNLGRGLLFLILTPILIVLTFITVIGIPIGLILLFLYIISLILAYLFLPIFFGGLVWKYSRRSESVVLDWKTALTGALIVVILNLIPFVGQLILFIGMLILLGALVKSVYQFFREQRR